MNKVCYRCKDEKEIEQFNKDKSRPDGRRAICKVCAGIKAKEYYDNNTEKIIEVTKAWYRRTHKERLAQRRKYYYNNREQEVRKSMEWNLKKIKEDDFFRMVWNMRQRHRDYFKSKRITKRNKGLFKAVGLTPEELRNHMERQFKDGMTWENYGKWHVDHIIPLSSAKTEEEVVKLFHYTNLQPLWAADNFKKGNRICPTL